MTTNTTLIRLIDIDACCYGLALDLDSEIKCRAFVPCLIVWRSRSGEGLHAKRRLLELIAEDYWSYGAPQARARLSMKAYAESQRDMEG